MYTEILAGMGTIGTALNVHVGRTPRDGKDMERDITSSRFSSTRGVIGRPRAYIPGPGTADHRMSRSPASVDGYSRRLKSRAADVPARDPAEEVLQPSGRPRSTSEYLCSELCGIRKAGAECGHVIGRGLFPRLDHEECRGGMAVIHGHRFRTIDIRIPCSPSRVGPGPVG